MAANTNCTPITVKTSLGDDMRRLQLAATGAARLEALTADIKAAYALPAGAKLRLTYADAEGDAVTLATEADLCEAVAALSLSEPLRIAVQRKSAAVVPMAALQPAAAAVAPAAEAPTAPAAAMAPVPLPRRRRFGDAAEAPATASTAKPAVVISAEQRAAIAALRQQIVAQRVAHRESVAAQRQLPASGARREEMQAAHRRFHTEIVVLKEQIGALKAGTASDSKPTEATATTTATAAPAATTATAAVPEVCEARGRRRALIAQRREKHAAAPAQRERLCALRAEICAQRTAFRERITAMRAAQPSGASREELQAEKQRFRQQMLQLKGEMFAIKQELHARRAADKAATATAATAATAAAPTAPAAPAAAGFGARRNGNGHFARRCAIKPAAATGAIVAATGDAPRLQLRALRLEMRSQRIAFRERIDAQRKAGDLPSREELVASKLQFREQMQQLKANAWAVKQQVRAAEQPKA